MKPNMSHGNIKITAAISYSVNGGAAAGGVSPNNTCLQILPAFWATGCSEVATAHCPSCPSLLSFPALGEGFTPLRTLSPGLNMEGSIALGDSCWPLEISNSYLSALYWPFENSSRKQQKTTSKFPAMLANLGHNLAQLGSILAISEVPQT